MKRVLLTADAPDQSGVAFIARHLATGLRRHGVEARVWFHRPGDRLADFAARGVPAEVRPGFGLAFGARSAAEALAFRPEAVHAQTVRVAGRSRRLARRVGAPLVVTAHDFDERDGLRFARLRDAGIAAVSDAVRERLTNAARVARDRIRVLPNALDLTRYPRPPFAAPDPADRRLPAIGTCGRLTLRKGRRVFLRMAARLMATGVDAEYVVLGEGPDRPALEELAIDLGIRHRTTFAPLGDPAQIANLDVLVEPSSVEGLGLSALQAMAWGVPVVAAAAGGIFSLVDDGATGLLAPPNDAEALAAAVRRLLADPAARTEMARQARDKVEERYDVARVAAAALDFYAERRELARAAAPPA